MRFSFRRDQIRKKKYERKGSATFNNKNNFFHKNKLEELAQRLNEAICMSEKDKHTIGYERSWTRTIILKLNKG